MVRQFISLVLTSMIIMILVIMPDIKTTLFAALICLSAFVAVNIILDKSDSVKW
ncbi:hypothetical protein ABNavy71_039 [Acinetobacter phage AB-Navy71]|nr:hypothetical protein CPT_Maestro_041 [Acinetobacter phage Maestro]QQM18531.1 hypothetical protein CPT_Morttis_038 [Acinetobacter phage Morttis]QQO96741.1 hypothetical protein CPT_Melin_040 [Acinetobacter phage Melin]UQS94116.1 hypothetical protein ABNavy71_039 [Acinetobacter phage AB-Navy71]SSU39411.1 Uncharacterised protein [Acinetobacter baumannii]